ncbi:ATP-binding cassette sub-family C member 4 isoform X2 [Nematostella vectensis]|nr:ATP-binding cassette sub-family C member 4 isoform X2 [Nematostella vectensis]XP_032237843.2 ATP-binding cassette sub-family C member 4 isoform X2 [Nematostella vectensis]
MGSIRYERLDRTILKGNPKSNASLPSSLTFWWMNDLLKLGSQQPLESTDLYPLLGEDQTKQVTDKLKEEWARSSSDKSSSDKCHGPGGWRLLRALFRLSPWYLYGYIFTTGLVAAICNICQPVFIGLLLSGLMRLPGSHPGMLYVYAAGLCISALTRVLILHQFMYNAWLMAMRWRAATMGLLFNKILRLSQTTINDVTTGYIVNLISGDVQRFDPVVCQMALFVQGLFEIAAVTGLLVYTVGVQSLAGIAFLVILVFYYCGMGRLCVYLRNRIAKIADERLGLMNAVLAGVRTVKMYAWELPFKDRVSRIRRQETYFYRLKAGVLATFQTFLYTCQSIAVFITLLVLIATGVSLDTFNVFMLLALVNTIRSAVSWNIAEGANYLGDFLSALHRIQNFLEVKELKKKKQTYFLDVDPKNDDVPRQEGEFSDVNDNKEDDSEVFLSEVPQISLDEEANKKPYHVTMKDVTCFWNGEVAPSLSHVTLELRNSDLVLVTGPVGCGKTSLLSAILGELSVRKGDLSVNGRAVYVPQCPWVYSGTVRENVLFGKKYQQWKYQVVVRACDLEKDLNEFPDRDLTTIGEHGVLLSGGQRTRIGLARALYADADIYLLDDPLSSVDAKVGRHIFDECVCGILKDKTRVLVTHQLQYLKGADHVVVMNAGSVAFEGTYEELRAHPYLELNLIAGPYNVSPPVARSVDSRRLSSASSLMEGDSGGLEVAEEDRLTGSVSWGLYWEYLVAGARPVAVVIFLVFFVASQACLVLPDWWLLKVTKLPRHQRNEASNYYTYGILVGAAFLLTVTRTFMFLFITLNSSRNLHNKMAATVLRAPVLFFDTNPTGRILNRFSRDIGVMDDLLPGVSLDAFQLVLYCVGAIILPTVLNPWVTLGAFPMIIIFILISRYYLRTSRELRRLEAINRSPVFSHFSDTLEGLVTIRTHHMQKGFIKAFYKHQDEHSKVWFTLLSALRWLGIRLDLLCVLFTIVVVFAAIAADSSAGATALSLIYALQLAVDTSQYGVRQCSETENYMTSVERVIGYTNILPESGYETGARPPSEWPKKGAVDLVNVSLAYYPGAPEVLKDVTFSINPAERVGIAGRTGAGKSSLVSALFRMPDPEGRILIDGLDISSIDIQSSRRAISVISQDPILFTGSLRLNLDPFDKYADEEIWGALEGASLKRTILQMPGQLMTQLMECGSNLSAGERQLLCLARAMLQRNNIIVLDEATANVDFKTDALIQETIRTKFKGCTVITIAHRLNTIMDYDKILVLERGRVAEYGTPQELMEMPDGVFRQLYESHVHHTI